MRKPYVPVGRDEKIGFAIGGCVTLLFILGFWITMIAVAYHFISKFW